MSFSPSINKLLAMPHARARREWQVVKVRSVAKSDVYIRGERPKLDGHRPRRPQGRLSVGVGKKARSVLAKSRVRTGGSQGNQIHSIILWTLGILKMYMGTLGYNVQISL